MVNELKSYKDKNFADNIEPQEWYDWFKKSNKQQSAISESDKVIDSIIERARDFALSDSSLDKPTRNEEIIRASKHLKNGKTISNDAICKEMIRCFVQTRFVDVLKDLFNAILTKTYFPKLWKINYISPNFKMMMPSIPITTGVLQLAVALVNYSLSLLMRDWLNF